MTTTSGRPAGPGTVAVQRSVVLETSIRLVFHATLVTGLFFLFAGHNSPGGGFVGGLVAGSAFVLRYLAGAGDAVGRVRVRPAALLGVGLLLSAAAAVAPWASGGQVLQSGYTSLELPVAGYVPLASVLVFDTGVFLVVVGLVLTVLTTLGAQELSSLGEVDPSPGSGQDVAGGAR